MLTTDYGYFKNHYSGNLCYSGDMSSPQAAVFHPHGLTMFSPVSLGTTPLSQSWGPAPVLAMTAVPTGNLKGFVCRHDLKPVGQPCDQPPCVSPSNAPAKKLDDGWPESEKHVLQAALSMVVVKNSR